MLDVDYPTIQNSELTKLEDGAETIVSIASSFVGVEKEGLLMFGYKVQFRGEVFVNRQSLSQLATGQGRSIHGPDSGIMYPWLIHSQPNIKSISVGA